MCPFVPVIMHKENFCSFPLQVKLESHQITTVTIHTMIYFVIMVFIGIKLLVLVVLCYFENIVYFRREYCIF